MHQAKVLDRSERLKETEALLRTRLGAAGLLQMGALAEELRCLLRVKVEDGNDMCMAEQMVVELNAFYDKLARRAAQTGASAREARAGSSGAGEELLPAIGSQNRRNVVVLFSRAQAKIFSSSSCASWKREASAARIFDAAVARLPGVAAACSSSE
eukprot:1862105-Pleurochrysis_carterae.AAC.1